MFENITKTIERINSWVNFSVEAEIDAGGLDSSLETEIEAGCLDWSLEAEIEAWRLRVKQQVLKECLKT